MMETSSVTLVVFPWIRISRSRARCSMGNPWGMGRIRVGTRRRGGRPRLFCPQSWIWGVRGVRAMPVRRANALRVGHWMQTVAKALTAARLQMGGSAARGCTRLVFLVPVLFFSSFSLGSVQRSVGVMFGWGQELVGAHVSRATLGCPHARARVSDSCAGVDGHRGDTPAQGVRGDG